MGNVGAGWYRDPEGSAQLRWWTGEAWTGATAAAPIYPAAPRRVSIGRTVALIAGGVLGFGALGVVALMLIAFVVAVNSPSTVAESQSQPQPDQPAIQQPPPKSAAQIQDEAQEASGWTVIESGALYGKFAAKDEYTCGYISCSYYLVLSVYGCPNALYVEGSTLANGVVVGMTNDLLSGVRAGETAAAHLQILEDGADSVRVSSVDCY